VAVRLAIAAVVLLHLAFIATVVAGGLLVARWPRLAWVQLPTFLWGAAINLAGWPCPLTTLENALRERAGVAPYSGSFVGHYLWHPSGAGWAGLRPDTVVGIFVMLVNAAVYASLLLRRRRAQG